MENWKNKTRAQTRRKSRERKLSASDNVFFPSKVNESLICDGMEKQIDEKRQRNQWAYSKGKSTESILLYLTEIWKGV